MRGRPQHTTIKRTQPPPIDEKLISWLERVYPNKPAHPDSVSSEKLWFYQGVQEVVRRLRVEYNRQVESAMSGG